MIARLYSNENFPLPVVAALRGFGHDVLTSLDAGKANDAIPDEEVLRYATADQRAVITHNRQDFIHLHRLQPDLWLGLAVPVQSQSVVGTYCSIASPSYFSIHTRTGFWC